MYNFTICLYTYCVLSTQSLGSICQHVLDSLISFSSPKPLFFCDSCHCLVGIYVSVERREPHLWVKSLIGFLPFSVWRVSLTMTGKGKGCKGPVLKNLWTGFTASKCRTWSFWVKGTLTFEVQSGGPHHKPGVCGCTASWSAGGLLNVRTHRACKSIQIFPWESRPWDPAQGGLLVGEWALRTGWQRTEMCLENEQSWSRSVLGTTISGSE